MSSIDNTYNIDSSWFKVISQTQMDTFMKIEKMFMLEVF